MGTIIAISTVKDGSMLSREKDNTPQIIKNRATFLDSQGISMDQTTRVYVDTLARATVEHDTNFCRYYEVKESNKGHGMQDNDLLVSDALVTRGKNHAIMLPIADCVGAVIYDPTHHVLMVSHLGRHSLEQQGGKKSIEHLAKTYDSRPEELLVWLTPAPSKESYPIWALDNKGMKEVVFEQLDAAGITQSNITDNPIETDKDLDYFSYSEFLKGHRSEDGDYAIVAMMTD
jgi:copper oxidase (laccase) domain-containing protein